MNMFKTLVAVLFTACACASAELSGYVTDSSEGHILGSGTSLVELRLDQLRRKTGVEGAVVVVDGLHGVEASLRASELLTESGAGVQDNRSTGFLILVSVEERSISTAVGYDLETDLSPSWRRINVEKSLETSLKHGSFREGIISALDAVEGRLLKSKLSFK